MENEPGKKWLMNKNKSYFLLFSLDEKAGKVFLEKKNTFSLFWSNWVLLLIFYPFPRCLSFSPISLFLLGKWVWQSFQTQPQN